MNVFEAETAKYERRIESIKRNPSPVMLASNKLYYELQLDENRELLKAWRQGKPFLLVAALYTVLMRCFGDFPILPMTSIADRLGVERAEASIDKVRAMGLPDYACDRTILFLPLAFMGEDLPQPVLMVSRTGNCEVINDTHRTLASLLSIPSYVVDIPFEDPCQQHLGYVTKQLEGLIKWVEATLPGAKFNEDKLAELQLYQKRWVTALHDIYRLRMRIPCPDHPRDVFHDPMAVERVANPSLLVKFYESYRDELRERAERGWSPVGEEKLRIVWAITGPYGSGVWDYLVKLGVSVPHWVYGAARRFMMMPNYGDETEFGRKLSPLEEEARMMLYNSWGGTGERWGTDVASACREAHADGLVLFEQTGCMPVYGVGQLVADQVEKEMGIPTWRVEGRQLLGRTERTESEFMAGLEAFINSCFERKRGR